MTEGTKPSEAEEEDDEMMEKSPSVLKAKGQHKKSMMKQMLSSLKSMQKALTSLAGQQKKSRRREEGPSEPAKKSIFEGGRKDVSLHEFLKLKLPVFIGIDVNADSQQYLCNLEKIFRVLKCKDSRAVEFAIYRLEGLAQDWYESVAHSRRSRAMTWEQFSQAFLKRFLPQSVREARAHEFETLTMQSGMLVKEYDKMFTQLSRYAPHLVKTEVERVRRFEKGLLDNLYRAVAPQRYTSYADALDCAINIQQRDI